MTHTPSMNACVPVSELDIYTIDCKGCIYHYFTEQQYRNKCPQCQTELGGKPLESLVRDITLQSIVDWLIPDFKERDDKLKAQLLKQINEKRM